jgi:hypothetical protein
MSDEILVFLNTHGLNIITLLLVLLSLFKDQIKAAVQRRIDLSVRRQEREADVEAKAWQRVFEDGTKANGYVDRLLIQAEHHYANLRERDAHIERFVTIAVEAVRDALAVMEATAARQQKNDEEAMGVLAELHRTLAAMHEQFTAIGIVLGLYLHDRQGITYDELLAATGVAKTNQQEMEENHVD